MFSAVTPLAPVAPLPESRIVLDIAELVRREGHRVYSASGQTPGIYQAMLCGLSVTFRTGGLVKAMKAHDMEIVVHIREVAAEQDDAGQQGQRRKLVFVDFIKGNMQTLAAWHRHLCAYRQSMCVTPVRDTVQSS